MHQVASNVNDKIWAFWDKEFNASVTDHDEQQITLEMKHVESDKPFFLTVVYAKCKPILRRPLWQALRHKSAIYDSPWCVIGYFNVIASVEEKTGGIPYHMNKSLEFQYALGPMVEDNVPFFGKDWIEYLQMINASTGSDHNPLLMEIRVRQETGNKYFRFLNLWVDNDNFKPFVKGIWEKHVSGSAVWIFHQKLKALCTGLSQWSRQEYGDIFQKAKEYEEKVKSAEMVWAQTNEEADRANLHDLKAQYIRYMKLEENFLKQKTQLQWFKEGDASSKYFHSLIRGRRRKLYIHKIKDEDGQWIQGDEVIGNAACTFYEDLFTDPGGSIREVLLSCIPSMITQEDNDILSADPTLSELKGVVFSMNPTSAAGPDGFNGKFYQSCWDIIKADLLNVVLAFFGGCSIPKYMTSACLVLSPKAHQFKQLHQQDHLQSLLQTRSYPPQNNLSKSIVHGIKKPNEGSNVVIKLDMAKAYDRMVIDMIWRTMSNNWYSVIVNGTRFGFFHSSRGLKQGDPLSPSLFIIGAELLSRMLNTLNHSQLFNGFYMERRGPQILNNYENTSGQQINRQKSHFMPSPCAFQPTIENISIQQPHIQDSWENQRLAWENAFIWGKGNFDKTCSPIHPIHLLSAISPPKIVQKQIEKIAANFFWGMDNNRSKYHWASWHKLCFPVKEGSLGFRTIADTCKSMELKQWWNFRTAQSLWSSFLRAKYCQRSNPISKKWVSGQSEAWKRMMFNKKEAEKNIRWRLHSAHHRNESGRLGNVQVSNFWTEGQWKQKLNDLAPVQLIPQIAQIPFFFNSNSPDEAIWTPNANGKFTCASAWEVIRNRKQPNFTNKMTRHKKIPFNETVDHLFNMGNFARIVWGRFSGLVGVQTEQIPLRLLLMKWWCLKRHNEVQKLILHTLPIIICWNLWKNRCSAKYGAKNSSLTRVLFSIHSDINLLLRASFPNIKWPLNWQELYPLIERLEHQTLSIQVIWEKPIPGFVKINSDGSALTNPGKIGAGVIVRDHNCTFIHAIAAPIGEGTNNYAETEGTILGIQWCLNIGFTKVHLETDSALLIQWFTNGKEFPWSLKMKLQQLIGLSKQCESFMCSHVYREANLPAHSLLKLSHELNTLTNYTSIASLPNMIRGQIQQDHLGTPSFRHKTTRRIKTLAHQATNHPPNVHV
ncbi:putative ribonuclease h protein [Nicotiana attenuata]|uniref:Ribonuclease h protein n=1 Tax=Nicotiana attenuata TaxID=49451 RepID=A0A314L6L4_NICAT|nr:putative ribonuclease h protein [Nicotiana attenuata]